MDTPCEQNDYLEEEFMLQYNAKEDKIYQEKITNIFLKKANLI